MEMNILRNEKGFFITGLSILFAMLMAALGTYTLKTKPKNNEIRNAKYTKILKDNLAEAGILVERKIGASEVFLTFPENEGIECLTVKDEIIDLVGSKRINIVRKIKCPDDMMPNEMILTSPYTLEEMFQMRSILAKYIDFD
jgi:hypothetical protein